METSIMKSFLRNKYFTEFFVETIGTTILQNTYDQQLPLL